jgi:CubicO group peptidase (beta-lactamase class C family)
MKLISILAATIILAAPSSRAASQSQDSVSREFDAYVAKAVRDWQAPGLSIAVVKDGKILFAKGYGVRELGKPEPFDTSTVSAIASTTKAMTAVAMGMLVDEGKVKWDDPVTKYLPSFQLYDPYSTQSAISSRIAQGSATQTICGRWLIFPRVRS